VQYVSGYYYLSSTSIGINHNLGVGANGGTNAVDGLVAALMNVKILTNPTVFRDRRKLHHACFSISSQSLLLIICASLFTPSLLRSYSTNLHHSGKISGSPDITPLNRANFAHLPSLDFFRERNSTVVPFKGRESMYQNQ